MIPRPQLNHQALDEELRRLTECKHPRLETRKKIKTDGTVEFKQQCLDCGDRIGNAVRKATLTPAEQNAVLVWDFELEKAYYKKRNETRIQLMRAEEQKQLQDWRRNYAIYLASDEWKRKRALVLLRANNICEGCRTKPATQVHHLTYVHLPQELLWELVAVCDSCHERVHVPPPLLSELEGNTQNSGNQTPHGGGVA